MKNLPIANDPTGAQAEEISRAMWRLCVAKDPAPEDTQMLAGWEIDEDGTAFLQVIEQDFSASKDGKIDRLLTALGGRIPAGQIKAYETKLKNACNAAGKVIALDLLPNALIAQLIDREPNSNTNTGGKLNAPVNPTGGKGDGS